MSFTFQFSRLIELQCISQLIITYSNCIEIANDFFVIEISSIHKEGAWESNEYPSQGFKNV